MIVLLIKSDLIRRQPLARRACANCDCIDCQVMELRQRYAEFAGGKVYPGGVFGLIYCQHCNYTLPASRWNDDLHRDYVALKTGYKTPISYWKGAIITTIGLLVGTILIYGTLTIGNKQQTAALQQRQAATEVAMKQPTPGITLATIANGQPAYDVWRVSHVTNDAVWLKKYTRNRTLTDLYTETGWASLPDSDFSAEAIAYTRAGFAGKGLRRVEPMADKNKPYEGVILTILDN